MKRERSSGLGRFLRRFRRDEGGTVSVEFVLMVPVFLTIFMASFESGLIMTRFVLLERALDMTVRDLRLGNFEFDEDATAEQKHDIVKAAICERSVIFNDCEDIMRLWLRPISQTTWDLPTEETPCIDRTAEIQAVTEFTEALPEQENELMLVRACTVFEPIFPSTGIGLRLTNEATGQYSIVARSAFVNEPSGS